MRTLLTALVLVAAMLALPGCESMRAARTAAMPMIDRGDVVEVSRRITERYAATWNANDMAGFGALYAADARHVNVSGDFLRGRTAIVAAHRANRERYAEAVRMTTRYEGARAVTDDAIVAVIIMEIVNDPANPGQVQATRLTMTLVRRDGDWQIAQAHASAPD